MIQPERLRLLNDRPVRPGAFVVYWMQASQRTRFNHALERAIERANELGLPLVTVFGLTDGFPEANLRHYAFLLEGLADVRRALARRGILLVVRRGDPAEVALEFARDAALVVVDCGCLRIQRAWRRRLAARAPCCVEQVESDAVVPVEAAADREVYSAAVLRPRIERRLGRFLVPLAPRRPRRESLGLSLAGVDVDAPDRVLAALHVDESVPPVTAATGGEEAAAAALDEFLHAGLGGYASRRSEPAVDGTSRLSAHLHFGHISPLDIALKVRARRGPGPAAFLEQLIVRRELSFNFCWFNRRYDRFAALPEWARATLARRAADARPALYSVRDLEQARTHDSAWNAAQRQLVLAGWIHGYMRMYWGKKILEWTPTPERAFRIALRLNNRYALDGRDPNSFAGVAWVFGKHDRPWGRRPVFGTVRSMTESGLRRKVDLAAYIASVEALAAPGTR